MWWRRLAIPLLLVSVLACPVEDSERCPAGSTSPSCDANYTPTEALLGIQPIAQQTEVWCWAAAAEMVLRHYGLPNLNPAANFQCGIVGAYFYMLGGLGHPCVSNCALCVTPIGSLTELRALVNNYGVVARQFGVPSEVLSARALFDYLSLPRLAAELDGGAPVIAGISFNGLRLPNISQHAVVIVGYDATGPEPVLYINDPYPYHLVVPPNQNPYLLAGGSFLSPGRYLISYQAFVTELVWANTLYDF